MHGLLGGAFNCNVNFADLHQKHPHFTPELLTFLLEYITTNLWPDNTFLEGYNVCDSDCERGSEKTCGCTCLVDAFSLSDDEVRPSNGPEAGTADPLTRASEAGLFGTS